MKPEHKHQCRYCGNCVVTAEDIPICECKEVQNQERGDHIPYKFNRPNKCSYWIFNVIVADFCGNDRKVYKPRKPSKYRQPRLFDMPTDKQRRNK